MTLVAKKQAISLPTPNAVLVRSITLGWRRGDEVAMRLSPMELIAIVLVLATQIATFSSRLVMRFEVSYWPSTRSWYEVSKTLGKVVAINMMLILFPVSKSSFWWVLLNYQFERVIQWHRWVSWWLVIVVALQAMTAIVSLMQQGRTNALRSTGSSNRPSALGRIFRFIQTDKIAQSIDKASRKVCDFRPNPGLWSI